MTILPLGDSITKGYISQTAGGYRRDLYNELTQAGYDFQFVGTFSTTRQSLGANNTDPNFNNVLPTSPRDQSQHEGHSGYEIADIRNNLTSAVQPSGAGQDTNNNGFWLAPVHNAGADQGRTIPDVILLHVGTNDIGSNDNLAGAAGSPGTPNAPGVKQRLTNLIADLRVDAPNAKILVASLIPINDRPNGASSLNTRAANNLSANDVLNIVNSFGDASHVRYVDMFDALTANLDGKSPDYYSPDGVNYDAIHPSNQGYDKMGHTWFQALQVAGVPEPTGGALVLAGAVVALRRSRRRAR